MGLVGCASRPRFLGEDPRRGARLQPPLEEELLRMGAGLGGGGMAGKGPGSCTREVGEGLSHGGAKPGEVVQEGKDAPGLEGACGEPEA